MRQTILVLPDVSAVVQRAAALISQRIQFAIQERGRCTLALSGGTSVGNVFELLVADITIDWSKVFLFWGDDRFVEQSNLEEFLLIILASIRT